MNHNPALSLFTWPLLVLGWLIATKLLFGSEKMHHNGFDVFISAAVFSFYSTFVSKLNLGLLMKLRSLSDWDGGWG